MHRLFLIAAIFSVSASANPSGGLSIAPKTCVVDASGKCDVKLLMQFKADSATPVCFVIPEQQQQWCSASAIEHREQIDISTKTSLSVEVREQSNRDLLDRARLELAYYEPAQTRRRRQFSWSF
ncbi:DUF3019 domain-containing protein [Aestuariibacter salexigens]|uniref:DUF3019 domain-containing protein n=1 Tax=Aestuariibacter salexigens TaxID=226010 RepID=UPI0004248CEA|nr:DUF3019 domain-containing protein [Aestuariibacter salexigens]